jgi:hypothetical protein
MLVIKVQHDGTADTGADLTNAGFCITYYSDPALL